MSRRRGEAITCVLATAAMSLAVVSSGAGIQELDIAAPIVRSLERGELTEAQLLHYFEDHATLLRANIEQARARHDAGPLSDLVASLLPLYLATRGRILSNYERFAEARDRAIRGVRMAYGDSVPSVVLVPCIGLFSAGGWVDSIGGTRHVFVALERLSEEQLALDILLTHEIAHGLSESAGETVLSGFYDEGHATFVSSVLCPGRSEEEYFVDMDPERYDRYLQWIDRNRERILEDSREPFVVLDDVHKLYFTTSFSEVPNIGYVIGFKYLVHLSEQRSLSVLRTFGMRAAENRRAFEEFMLSSRFERRGKPAP